MSPKGKEKKGKPDVPDVAADFTRRPLPAVDPCDARPAPRAECAVVSAHHEFEEWDCDAIAEMDWGVADGDAFEDTAGRSSLPPRLAALTVGWVRPKDLIEKIVVPADDAAGGKTAPMGKEGKTTAVDKGKGKPKRKDKGKSLAPAVLDDASADEDGNPLPRVFVPRAAAVGFPVDGGVLPSEGFPGVTAGAADINNKRTAHANEEPIPRGFRQTWSSEQLAKIASNHRQQQQQQQQQREGQCRRLRENGGRDADTPPEGVVEEEEPNMQIGDRASTSPVFLVEEAVGMLGTPCGGDIDPLMTAVFKAVGQLSPMCSSTGCPLLWEAVYPQTPAKVPCYNPCGRYAVRLFAAGRWRKVEVDDAVPIDAARSPIISASEDPVELWPLMLSKALYKLHRLGGYSVAQQAAAAPREEGSSSGGREGSDGGDVDRARFVAFALHSLTGWIPSIVSDVPSTEVALSEGTPGLTSDDLCLPALPPVDEEEEAARERLEERKRRQALFLHKKRRPRKVERKIVSAEERAEVNFFRRQKMEAVTGKIRAEDRREVYMVCMPGEPAYPILAVCPPVHPPSTVEEKRAATSRLPCDRAVNTSNSSDRKITIPDLDQQHSQTGFLLKWETPSVDKETPTLGATATGGAEIGVLPGGLVGETALSPGAETYTEAKADEEGFHRQRHFGGGAGRLGNIEASAADPAKNAAASLATPTYLWLTPREIRQARGVIVRALTKVGKEFKADVQYHWRAAIPEPAEVIPADKKAGKDKAKGGKGKAMTRPESGKELPVGGETDTPEVEHPPPDAGPCAGPKRPQGTRARDPGYPPAIYLRINPSPRPEPSQETPPPERATEEDYIATESSGEHTDTTLAGSKAGGGAIEAGGTTVVAGGVKHPENNNMAAGGANNAEENFDAKQNASRGVPGEENEEEEQEEAEIIMCLWADQPAAGTEAGMGDNALAVLQGVTPLGSPCDTSKPLLGGNIVLRARYNAEKIGLPLAVTSTKIRMIKGESPRVFRILLQPGLGCCLGFCCTHEVQTGDAAQVWEEAGHSQVAESGKYDGARAGEWRILFRRAFWVSDTSPMDVGQSETLNEESTLVLSARETSGADGGESIEANPVLGDNICVLPNSTPETSTITKIHEQQDTSCTTTGKSSGSLTFVKAILHLPDESVRPSVRLAFIDEDDGTEMAQPSLHTNFFPLRPNVNGYTILAAACSRTKPISKGAWRLQLLSTEPLLSSTSRKRSSIAVDGGTKHIVARGGGKEGTGEETGATPSGVATVSCQERSEYGGVYEPNKYFLLFRDVLTCASPLPFAVRLRCSLSSVCLRLTFIDASTGRVIQESKGGNILQALSVTPPTAPLAAEHAAAATPSPKEAAKAGKKGAAAVAEHSVLAAPGRVIVEAAIDWGNKQVPPHLASDLPYYFQPTLEGLEHYCPPLDDAIQRRSSAHRHGSDSNVTTNGQAQTGSACEVVPPPQSANAPDTTAQAAAEGSAPLAEQSRSEGAEGVAGMSNGGEKNGVELRWWLEIVGAGEVEMAHDTTGVDRENAEVERWEAAEPGRAVRAALLWTQRQASKVVNSGGANITSRSAENDTQSGEGDGGDGQEDWIKARAAAVGVPVELEKERQACRAVLPTRSLPAPSSGTCSAGLPPSAVVVLGLEDLLEREKERATLRTKTKQFKEDYEAQRARDIEAGKEEMAMQLEFIRGREKAVKAARMPFLRDRELIVQDMIAKAKERKEAIEVEREALEAASNGKGKQSKAKPGKK